MKVGLATGDWVEGAVLENGDQILGGSGWIRFGQYEQRSSLNTVIGELIWDRSNRFFGVRSWDGVEHLDIDIVVMQRWMHNSIPERVKEVRKKGQIILNDLDDWYWGLSDQNLAFVWSHPKTKPDENINHYKKTLVNSDGVLVSTEYLADRLSQFIPRDRIYVMENHVEIDKFSQRVHTEKEKPIVGWVGSTAHRSGDLAVLKSVYRQTGDNFAYHHSGHVGWHPHFYDEVGLGKDEVFIQLPVPPQKLDEVFSTFDIGTVPLILNPFNESKSWLKGVEYAAAGLPFIATPSGEYKRLKKEYGVGRLAKNVGQWVKHLEQLRDPAVRQEEADANFEAIQPLDVSHGTKKWDDLIMSFT